MKGAIAKCPSIKLKNMDESGPSLLDSGSMASLMWQDYFNSFNMFDLTSANRGSIPLSKYVELDIE